ncbi:MAG: hypothetical protein J3Q66DRAFT_342333 [Benniella sp.]|nr:MAG: hypothetical protein J3Q66DRAFT_342333 [Benniella sp.]
MVAWNTEIPTTPIPNLVVISNISPAASEKTVKDFFGFCGKFRSFELQPDGDHQVALAWFEQQTAATTACMLTNAMIVDSPVTVKPYFEDNTTDDAQENKPRARILAELLAAGYKIQDAIIEKGLELDAKLGVTGKVQGYVETVKATAIAQAHAIDEKFKVTEKASELDNKYHVQDRVNAAVEQGIGYKDQALQSVPGQKVTNIAVQVKDQIAAVHHEARRIADEKKAKSQAQSGEAGEAHTEAPAEVPATKEA